MRLACCFLLLASAARAGDFAAELFPPGTSVVMGIQMRRLAPLLQTYSASMPPAGAQWLKAASMLGFDPLRDVDELLVASRGNGGSAQSLIVATGSFESLRARAAGGYQGVPVIEGGRSSIAFMDGFLVAGLPGEVRGAIARRGRGAALDPALAAAIGELRGRYDVWGAGNRPAGFAAAGAPQGFDSIDRFRFGVDLSAGLSAEAEIHARDPRKLAQFAQSLRLVESALKAQPSPSDSARFDFRQDGGALKFSLSISEEEFKRAAWNRTALMARLPGVAPAISGAETNPQLKGAPASSVTAPNGDTLTVTLPGR